MTTAQLQKAKAKKSLLVAPKQQVRTINYIRPSLTSYQLDAFFGDFRWGATEGTTKAGKTFVAICWLWEEAAIHRGGVGRFFWWLAPSFQQSSMVYRRLKFALPKDLCKCNDTALTIELPNGSVIAFKSGEIPDNLYGAEVSAAVLDEVSRMRIEAWHAVRSTLVATKGKARLIGNVRGRGWFYQLCRKAEAGEPGWHYSKITALDAVREKIITANEVADAKRTLPESVFKELFMAEAADNSANPFGVPFIEACTTSTLADGPAVIYGVDLAKSVDYSIILGLNASGAVCHFSRFQLPWKETIERVRTEVGTTRTIADSSGVGDPVVEELQRGSADHTVLPLENIEAFKFTSTSKQQIMEGLAVGIQQKKVSFPQGPISAELSSFEYEYSRTGVRYSAPEGSHDDAVCALALAYSGLTAPQSVAANWNAWV